MTLLSKRKNQLISAGMCLAFVYMMGTEIADQWLDTLHAYVRLQQKELVNLSPEAISEKRISLLLKKRSLASVVTKESGEFDQNQTGVFEFLIRCAMDAGIRFESLTPLEPDSSGQIREVGFKLTVSSSYARVAAFLAKIENGRVAVRMKKLGLASKSAGSPPLQATAEGTAYILPGNAIP